MYIVNGGMYRLHNMQDTHAVIVRTFHKVCVEECASDTSLPKLILTLQTPVHTIHHTAAVNPNVLCVLCYKLTCTVSTRLF